MHQPFESERGFSRPDRNARLVEDADRFRTRGEFVAAGALARVALERKLRSLCRTHNLTPHQSGGVLGCMLALRGRRILSNHDFRRLKPLLKSANAAAHGYGIDAVEAAELIFVVGDFVEREDR